MDSSGKRVALYARASTDEQAHSIHGQLRELREYAEKEGFRVVAEVGDQGEKRHTLERPGIEELRDLCAAGDVEEVWAWAWDRYGEFPQPEVLVLELEDFGTVLRSLDDGGAGDDSFEIRAIKSMFSRKEQRSRRDRSRRGRDDKTLRGEIFGGFRARYGFRFLRGPNQTGKEVNVGYEVDPEKMVHVCSIFEMIAAGQSIHAVQRELEQSGIPAPGYKPGGKRWSRTTIKNTVLDDVYMPHALEEVEDMVPSGVAAKLDPEKMYGIHWSGRKRSKFKNNRSKQRIVYETPPEEWTAIPVDLTGSGLDRATVEAAREQVRDNKSPSRAGDRFWELSELLKCAECGRNMIAYRRAKKHGYNHYYRCRPSSTVDYCPNRKSHPAGDLEAAASRILAEVSSNKENFKREIAECCDMDIERLRRAGSGADTGKLAELLESLEMERKGYLRQNARGILPDAELDGMLSEIDQQRHAMRQELEEAMHATEKIAEMERDKRDVLALIEAAPFLTVVHGGLEPSGAQLRREYYEHYRMRFEVNKEGQLKGYGRMWLREGALQSVPTSL